EGESGHRKLNQYTRYLTIGILMLQAPSYMANLSAQLPSSAFILSGTFFKISSWIILTAGTMFVMWLGERITDKGIGNGISLIIMIGIVARLPQNFIFEAGTRLNGAGGAIALIVELVIWYAVILGTIMLVQGTRRIPVQYARRIVGNKQYGGVRQYIPLKVNAAGVMPIIFAQAIMMLPLIIAGYSNSGSGFVVAFTNMYGFWYNLITAILIILFTYFYTAITINPQQMADDMKKNGGFIPGVKPGRKTVEFFDDIMSKITLPGSIFLAIIAILPAIAVKFGVSSEFAQFYGGTSLLILVGVILDTLQQIESHLLMRHYDGLMKSGRIKGRTGRA
ncbi:MAG: preprotein translocase subunit SecY, partial [Bacteroidales bacterium]|nr:preprotein translocase subunit SecY [Bacteroidales bacterium]